MEKVWMLSNDYYVERVVWDPKPNEEVVFGWMTEILMSAFVKLEDPVKVVCSNCFKGGDYND